jgi:tetratricopeptide (TPR) repeat protein
MGKNRVKKIVKQDNPSVNIEHLIEESTAYISCGNGSMAEPLLLKVLELQPGNTEALDLAGEMFAEMGEYSKAITAFEESIRLAPNENGQKYMSLGQLKLGKEALLLYQYGCTLFTNDPISLCLAKVAIAEMYLTDLCLEPEAEQACIQALHEAYLANPTSIERMQTECSLYISQHKKEDAINLLLQVADRLNTETQSLMFRTSTCRLLIELEQYVKAIPILEGIWQEEDENVEVWILLGLAHYHINNIEEARECYENAIQLLNLFLNEDPLDTLFQAQLISAKELLANLPV